MAIGASDPWLNVTYSSGTGFYGFDKGGYFGGNGNSLSNTWVNSGIGAMRPYLGLWSGAGLSERIIWGMMWESNLSGGQVVNNVVNP
jgi:hypothetical protein